MLVTVPPLSHLSASARPRSAAVCTCKSCSLGQSAVRSAKAAQIGEAPLLISTMDGWQREVVVQGWCGPQGTADQA
jgi:hypothetical protein